MRIQSFPSLLLLVFLLASAQGCDTGGIYPLNAELDVSCTGVKSTWLRTTEEGTELFLFTQEDPLTPVADPPSRNNCFVRALIHNDSSTDLEQGTYTLDASGKGVFSVLHTYTMWYQDDTVKLGGRNESSAKRDDMPSPSSHALTVEADGDHIIVGMDSERRRLTNIYDVVQRLGSGTQAEAEDAFRFLNLSIYTSAVRIVGFGGYGMSQYMGALSHFVSLVANEYTVEVKGKLTSPDTYITYAQFEDMNGVIIDGSQLSATDYTGTGDLSGVLTWRMRASADPDDVWLSGELDYEGVHVKNGVASSGEYTFTIGDDDYQILYSLSSDLNLQTILPLEEGQP